MYRYRYPHPAVTVDCVVYRPDASLEGLELLLIQRGNSPEKGKWALPGGFIEIDEDLPDAARRELFEETSIKANWLEQLGAFGQPDRDPRERIVTVVYFTLLESRTQQPVAGSDAGSTRFFPLNRLPDLAFDHQEIINSSTRRLKESVILAEDLQPFLPPSIPFDQQRIYLKNLFGLNERQISYVLESREKKL